MANVKHISVRRLKRCVEYGSVLAAEYLDRENSKINFISIRYYGEPDVDFKNADQVLYLRDTNGIEDIDLDLVTTFMNTLEGDSVFVHCQMGTVRSKWLAKWIADNYDYKLKPLVSSIVRYD